VLDILTLEAVARVRHHELIQQAERERLAYQVAPAGRRLRTSLAGALRSLAERIDQPRVALTGARG
jgi:hypothetical protein